MSEFYKKQRCVGILVRVLVSINLHVLAVVHVVFGISAVLFVVDLTREPVDGHA